MYRVIVEQERIRFARCGQLILPFVVQLSRQELALLSQLDGVTWN